ncbi:MAG: M48 family metallopeptidase [Bacilli bacterium]|jgi:predicted metal-dependent hydrolase
MKQQKVKIYDIIYDMKSGISFRINEKKYPVTITRKKMKRIVIKMNRTGGILVSCPHFCSDKVVLGFLEKNRPWLEKTASELDANDQELGISACLEFKRTYFKGILYSLKQNADLKTPYLISNDTIYYQNDPKSAVEKLLRDNYSYIEGEFERVKTLFKDSITQSTYLTIRKMKSRWGSCNYKTGRITINRALVHLPAKLLHYVMFHEFTHLLYPNHGKLFRAFLKKHLPDFRESERELKKYSFLLNI